MPIPSILTVDFERFLTTSSYFRDIPIISRFQGVPIRLYDGQMMPMHPVWIEGINPLNIKVDWNGFAASTTTTTTDTTCVITGPNTVRITNTSGYSSSHILQVHTLYPTGGVGSGLVFSCTFSVSGPLTDSTTGPVGSSYPFVVRTEGIPTTTTTGYLEFLDIPPMVYRQFSKEFDLMHLSVTREMKLCLSVNTGGTILGRRSFITIGRQGPGERCHRDPPENTASSVPHPSPIWTQNNSDHTHDPEMKGYLYHIPPNQMTYDQTAVVMSDKRASFYFDLYDLAPGMYNARLFDPDLPLITNTAVTTIQFHSRQHTDIEGFQRHVHQPLQNMMVHVNPKSSTEFEIVIQLPPPGTTNDIVQLKQHGIELGWFPVHEDGRVIINTLTHRVQPGYYDIEHVHQHTKIVLTTMRIFIGVYMSDEPQKD